jgi:hypothetical protein
MFAWFWGVWSFNGEEILAVRYGKDYGVYFYNPNKREEYLGRVKGLDACAGRAYLWAKSKNKIDSMKWKYKCELRIRG